MIHPSDHIPVERPILFNTAMVNAILLGKKTHTRRPAQVDKSCRLTKRIDSRTVCCAPIKGDVVLWRPHAGAAEQPMPASELQKFCPLGIVGDRLWVRETWAAFTDEWKPVPRPNDLRSGPWQNRIYAADGLPNGIVFRPNIHMPRWASRLTLEINFVELCRVQSITEHEAIQEGFEPRENSTAINEFAKTWIEIYGRNSWCSNAFVWNIGFALVPKTPT